MFLFALAHLNNLKRHHVNWLNYSQVTTNYGITAWFFTHNNLPPFKSCLSAEAEVDRVTASFPTNTGRRRKSWGISARQRAQRRLRPATPFMHRKQKTCEHGNCTAYEHGCRQTGHSARDVASSADTGIIQRTATISLAVAARQQIYFIIIFARCHTGTKSWHRLEISGVQLRYTLPRESNQLFFNVLVSDFQKFNNNSLKLSQKFCWQANQPTSTTDKSKNVCPYTCGKKERLGGSKCIAQLQEEENKSVTRRENTATLQTATNPAM